MGEVRVKGNAACVLQAGRVRGFADFVGDFDWEEDIDDLLREAAAAAGWDGFGIGRSVSESLEDVSIVDSLNLISILE